MRKRVTFTSQGEQQAEHNRATSRFPEYNTKLNQPCPPK